jgi:ABC-2 type transport system permease protein
MSFTRIYAIYLRQWYLVKSNPIRLASTFLWIFISLAQWGFISRYIGTFGGATVSFVTVILGAIILWEFMSRIQQGISMTFMEDVWSQNFINFFASPLKVFEYLSGMVMTGIVQGIFGFGVMVALAGIFFGYDVFKAGLLLVPALLIPFLFGISMGFYAAALMFRFGPTAEWLVWPIPLILSILSGVFYPISILPGFLQIVARCIPASYVFEGMRAVLATGQLTSQIAYGLLVGAVLDVAYLFLLYSFFISVYKRNLRTGGISRFGAENA